MPNNAPAIKREATAALGAEIVLVGPGSAERQLKAEELAAQHGYVIVPPYNDEKIIAGQGTIGLEILEDLPEVEAVFAPVGGGGLISGVAAAIKLTKPEVQVIGVEPELAADAQASLRAGKIVQFPAEQVSRTIADGLRTQSVGAINFEHMQCFVDDIVTVTEDEIRQAMKLLGVESRHRSRTQRRSRHRRIPLPRRSIAENKIERSHHLRRQHRTPDARRTPQNLKPGTNSIECEVRQTPAAKRRQECSPPRKLWVDRVANQIQAPKGRKKMKCLRDGRLCDVTVINACSIDLDFNHRTIILIASQDIP